jgi:flagellar assembly factor FliW
MTGLSTTGRSAKMGAMQELPAIELVHPIPGFPGNRRFALVQLDDDGLLCQLRSLEDPSLRFLVMPPVPFFPDYAPEVSDEVVEDLQIESADDVIVLLVLNAGESLDTTTANLMAPVVVNTATRRASQVILDDPSLPIAAPLVA